MQFNGGAVDAVYALTGGHPFFARQLCSFIADQHRERPIAITRALAEGVVDQYLDARTADFQEIVDRLARDFPQEQALCVDLAIAGGALPIEQVRGRTVGHAGSTLRHLIGYQLIATDQRNAWLTIELFTRWLRQRYISD